MSGTGEWGTLVKDWTPAPSEPESRPADLDTDAGAWPESVSIESYADTSLTIPGQSAPPADCGEYGPRTFCDSCADLVIAPHQCGGRSCADCWSIWRADQTVSAVERLAGARREAPTNIEKRLVHGVASPKVETYEIRTLTQFNRMISDAYDVLKESGIRGGVVVPHGWRVKAHVKRAFAELKEADAVSGGIWKWIREHKKDWRTMTFWSPHVHVLGLATEVEPVETDDWIVERIDTFSSFNIYQEQCYRDMAKAYSYLLSHLAFDPEGNGHSIRWYGVLANNQFSLEQLEDWEQTKIERMTAKILGEPVNDDDEAEAGLAEKCECDDCDGRMRPIYDAGIYLGMYEWCDQLDRETERRLNVAFQWAIGDLSPPPGLKSPKTEDDANKIMDMFLS